MQCSHQAGFYTSNQHALTQMNPKTTLLHTIETECLNSHLTCRAHLLGQVDSMTSLKPGLLAIYSVEYSLWADLGFGALFDFIR
jgi:hypothetical protein